MKNARKIITTAVVMAASVTAVLTGISLSLYGSMNFLEISMPHNEYGQIDFVKIGYDKSQDDFKKRLDAKNIQYNPDNLLLIAGAIEESYPPNVGYCGYVMADNGDGYWYTSVHRGFDTFTGKDVTDKNPMPCQPNMGSCICALEEEIAKKNFG